MILPLCYHSTLYIQYIVNLVTHLILCLCIYFQFGYAPLHLASNDAVVETLIKHGASVHALSKVSV